MPVAAIAGACGMDGIWSSMEPPEAARRPGAPRQDLHDGVGEGSPDGPGGVVHRGGYRLGVSQHRVHPGELAGGMAGRGVRLLEKRHRFVAESLDAALEPTDLGHQDERRGEGDDGSEGPDTGRDHHHDVCGAHPTSVSAVPPSRRRGGAGTRGGTRQDRPDPGPPECRRLLRA